MRIIFTTNNPKSPSFIFYSKSFKGLSDLDNSISIDIIESINDVDFTKYDVLFLMGGNPEISEIKKTNPSIYCILIEPRAKQYNEIEKFDCIISNSLESDIFFNRLGLKSFIYPTYPIVNSDNKSNPIKDKFIIGYHGNKVHFENMFPRITDAIFSINKSITVELWAMYNIEKSGKSKIIDSNKLGFIVKHIQYSKKNYNNYIANCHVGLVPQLIFKKIPLRSHFLNWLISEDVLKKFKKIDKFYDGICNFTMKKFGIKLPQSSRYDYKLAFKEVTNLGRHFVFAQYSIPIVADLTPSSCSFIKHGINSYIAFDTSSWIYALDKLANESERIKLGKQLYTDWNLDFSHPILNKRLIDFIKQNINEKNSKD